MELKEKNQLLRDKIENLEKNGPKTSYANAVLQKPAPKSDSGLPLVITLKNKKDSDTIRSKVKKILNGTKIKVNKLVNTAEGKILIRCSKKEEAEEMKDLVDKELKSIILNAEVRKLKNPRVKIPGIQGDISAERLRTDLIDRNDIETTEEGLKVVHTYTNKRTKTNTAVLEMSCDVYKQIKKNSKIFVGWQSCAYYDDYNVNMCYNCCGFNHSKAKCQRKPVCANCAGEHQTWDCECQSEVKKCINCIESNNKYKTNRSIDHCASNFDYVKLTNLRWNRQ